MRQNSFPLDPRGGGIHVVDHEVEVHPVLHGLRLRHVDAEHRGREHRETLGVRAIDLDPADASDGSHGCSPTNSSPAVSAKPSATFIACTPFPAAPFMRLSIAHRATMRSPRGSTAKPTSAKFVPASSFGSG